MSYIQGFLLAVPAANKDAYIAHANAAVPLLKEFGADRLVEGWGDDVPDGKITDFRRATQAKEDEVTLFSWIEFPDKATADAAGEKMMNDPRMEAMGEMPFDGMRMMWGGFEPLIDEGDGGATGYVDGFVAAVPTANRDAYVTHVREAAAAFRRLGVTRAVEGWGVDVPKGKVTDFHRAVQAKDDETVVFSWLEWPDKATRDAGFAAMQDDPAFREMQMPFDGQRMIYGGFAPVVDR